MTEEEKVAMMKKMDDAAVEADKELRYMAHKDSIPLARWFMKHYTGAGHKRLGRALVAFAKETKDLRPEQFGPADEGVKPPQIKKGK
jgi:hypothetical protein